MIDKAKTRTYLMAMRQGSKPVFSAVFLGLFLLLALQAQLLAGGVQDGTGGRDGQTLNLESLPVKGKTTLVDCYSPYCPPCMQLAPLLEQLAQKRSDLVVKKVNIQRPEVSGKIDWQSPLAKQLGLHSIPHFMIFNQQGKLTTQGSAAANQVMSWLQEVGLLKK